MKEKKNYYFGKYYKFVSNDNYAFALIDAETSNGRVMQIITKKRSYIINNPNQVKIDDAGFISFNIHQKGLHIEGVILLGKLHPLSKDVMGFLRNIKINTKHNIYSMYHKICGILSFNGKDISFYDGVGYIEGDEGNTFPDKYIWFNSISTNYGLSLSIAEIKLFNKLHLRGSFIVYKDLTHEFVFSTLNGLKIKVIGKYLIVLRKGKYKFKVYLDNFSPLPLLSPIEGSLVGEVKESISVSAGFEIYKGREKIISNYNTFGSIERVNLWDLLE